MMDVEDVQEVVLARVEHETRALSREPSLVSIEEQQEEAEVDAALAASRHHLQATRQARRDAKARQERARVLESSQFSASTSRSFAHWVLRL